jgi:hypothetical protein
MSVANLCFKRDRVLVASDTLTYAGDDPVGLTDRKVHVADGGRYAFSARGLVVHGRLARALAHVPTFDAVAPLFGDLVRRLAPETRETAEGFEVMLFGWSDAAGALCARRFRARRDGAAEAVDLPHGVHLFPGIGDRVRLPDVVTAEGLVRLSLAQAAAAERFGLRMCIGGVLHLTSVDRAGCVQSIAGLYSGYDAHAAAFGDPNAAAVATWRAAPAAVAA